MGIFDTFFSKKEVPIPSVLQIEQLLLALKETRTIILVSHYMDQVKRIADRQLVLADRKLVPLE